MNFIDFFAQVWPLTDKSRAAVSAILRLYREHGRKAVQFTTDAEGDRWVTTENKHRVLLDKSGYIIAGFGGKFTGQKIGNLSGGGASSGVAALNPAPKEELEYAKALQQDIKKEIQRLAKEIDPSKIDMLRNKTAKSVKKADRPKFVEEQRKLRTMEFLSNRLGDTNHSLGVIAVANMQLGEDALSPNTIKLKERFEKFYAANPSLYEYSGDDDLPF